MTETGSLTSRYCLSGTSLNMYSTGNSKSSLDSLSWVCFVMKEYSSFMSLWGNPIIVSMAPMSNGVLMAVCSLWIDPR